MARALFGNPGLRAQAVNSRILVVEGYDYHRLKNALLSILWRMSVSSHSFFKNVELGEKHEEILRAALLADSSFSEETYPITLTAPIMDGQFYEGVILSPDCERVGKNRIYRCVISGLLFIYFVGGAPLDEVIRSLILRRKSWPMVKANVQQIPFLFEAYRRIAIANVV